MREQLQRAPGGHFQGWLPAARLASRFPTKSITHLVQAVHEFLGGSCLLEGLGHQALCSRQSRHSRYSRGTLDAKAASKGGQAAEKQPARSPPAGAPVATAASSTLLPHSRARVTTLRVTSMPAAHPAAAVSVGMLCLCSEQAHIGVQPRNSTHKHTGSGAAKASRRGPPEAPACPALPSQPACLPRQPASAPERSSRGSGSV